jgi:hypothetical protein
MCARHGSFFSYSWRRVLRFSFPARLRVFYRTVFWCSSFFFASADASSAYLTVSEIFPLEVRGQAIFLLLRHAQVVGSMGPLIFANFVGNGTDRVPLFTPTHRAANEYRNSSGPRIGDVSQR